MPMNTVSRYVAGGLSAAAALSAAYLINPWEGEKKTSDGKFITYADPIGIPTACNGLTGKDMYNQPFRIGRTYTQKECDTMFIKRLQQFEKQVDAAVKVPYASPYQKASLLSFTYNVGIGNFRSSTALRKLNAKDHAGACKELIRWTYAGGKFLRGLLNRRTQERAWCEGKVPTQSRDAYALAAKMVQERGGG
jgi:lysozyme